MRTLLSGCTFLEGLCWHEGRFWAVDAYAGRVLAASLNGEVEEILSVADIVSSVGWHASGDLLVVSMSGDRLLRLSTDGVTEHADLASLVRGHPNDMVVDAAGRAFIGTTGFDIHGGAPIAPGCLIRVEPDGSASVVADDLLFPNGMAILDQGRTLLVAESFGQRLTAFALGADGSLTERREWARFGEPAASESLPEFLGAATLAPDGIAVDRQGRVWVADPLGKRVVALDARGEIVRQFTDAKGFGIFTCAIGGADGKLLAVCVAESHDPDVLKVRRSSRIVLFDLDD